MEVKIGFDTKDKRYEIGDTISKDDIDNKTFDALVEQGVIGKKEKDPIVAMKKEAKKKSKSNKKKEYNPQEEEV